MERNNNKEDLMEPLLVNDLSDYERNPEKIR